MYSWEIKKHLQNFKCGRSHGSVWELKLAQLSQSGGSIIVEEW